MIKKQFYNFFLSIGINEQLIIGKIIKFIWAENTRFYNLMIFCSYFNKKYEIIK